MIFLGGTDLEFQRWAETSFPELPFDYGAAAAADFDGDGDDDLALAFSDLRGANES
ncbi:MAG: VCBS repeat-containing protein, partial [Acidobacteria bacterium]|nr:VCBS repeat-containing protein [Acidobacteriota bacterium]